MTNEKFEPGSFVRFFSDETDYAGQHAFVEGVLGRALGICLIPSRESIAVEETTCRLVSPIEITGGLTGIMACHTTFDVGQIMHEECIDNLLYVQLQGPAGHLSEFFPITFITVCCPCC